MTKLYQKTQLRTNSTTTRRGSLVDLSVAWHIQHFSLSVRLNRFEYGSWSSSDVMFGPIWISRNCSLWNNGAKALSVATAMTLKLRDFYIAIANLRCFSMFTVLYFSRSCALPYLTVLLIMVKNGILFTLITSIPKTMFLRCSMM